MLNIKSRTEKNTAKHRVKYVKKRRKVERFISLTSRNSKYEFYYNTYKSSSHNKSKKSKKRPFDNIFSFFYFLILSNWKGHKKSSIYDSPYSKKPEKCCDICCPINHLCPKPSSKRHISSWVYKISTCKTIIKLTSDTCSLSPRTTCKSDVWLKKSDTDYKNKEKNTDKSLHNWKH